MLTDHYNNIPADELDDAQSIANAHWSYIRDVIKHHNPEILMVELDAIGFHYVTAFIHGWKHGIVYHKLND